MIYMIIGVILCTKKANESPTYNNFYLEIVINKIELIK